MVYQFTTQLGGFLSTMVVQRACNPKTTTTATTTTTTTATTTTTTKGKKNVFLILWGEVSLNMYSPVCQWVLRLTWRISHTFPTEQGQQLQWSPLSNETEIKIIIYKLPIMLLTAGWQKVQIKQEAARNDALEEKLKVYLQPGEHDDLVTADSHHCQ